MARVPTVTDNMVRRNPVSGAGMQGADVGEAGRIIGGAVQRFGGALAQFGEDQDQIDATLDEAGSKLLDTEYSNWSRKTLFEGDDAFYSKEGFGAANARGSFEKSIGDKREELLGKATTPRMRKILSDALDRRSGADMEGIARYSVDQLRVANTRASAARVTTSADDAVTYANDPKRFETELAVGLTEIDSDAARTGAPPDETKRKRFEFKSNVYARVTRGLIGTGKIDEASDYFDANKDKLTPDARDALAGALYEPLLERKADRNVDALLGVGGDTSPVAPGGPKLTVDKGYAAIVGNEGGTDKNGRFLTSPKGAIGPAQVMPGTAPFAAKLAGVPFDEQKYKSDPAYNNKLGKAYYKYLLDKFDGDAATAAAAYNAGPGDPNAKPGDKNYGKGVYGAQARAKAAGQADQWRKFLPKETRDYIDNFNRRTGGTTNEPGEFDLNDMLARVDAMDLPFDEKQRTRRQLIERVGTNENLKRREQDTAGEDALTLIDNGDAAGKPVTRYSQIPQTTWDKMSPQQRQQTRGIIDRNATLGGKGATNYGTYTYLSDLYAKDPASFVKVDPLEYRGNLAAQDYETVMGWRRDAIKATGQGGRSANQVTFSRISGVADNALKSLGITTDGLKTSDKAGRETVSKRTYLFQQRLAADVEIWQRANPGKDISDSEISGMADRLLTRWRPSGTVADPKAPPTFYFERTAPSGVLYIPTADRERIRRQGRARLGREPSESEISNAYISEARGGR